MNIIKTCEFCEMSLAFEVDGKVLEFTKHDDETCKLTMRNTIRMMRDVLKSNAELMAQKCIEFGMEIERRRGESDHARNRGRQEGLIAAALRDAVIVRDISKTGGEG